MSVVAVKILENFISISADSICIVNCSCQENDGKLKKIKISEKGRSIIIGSVGQSEDKYLLHKFLNESNFSDNVQAHWIFQRFMAWIDEKYPYYKLDISNATYLCILDEKVFFVESYIEVTEIKNYYAIGGGAPSTLGVMYAGGKTLEAVEPSDGDVVEAADEDPEHDPVPAEDGEDRQAHHKECVGHDAGLLAGLGVDDVGEPDADLLVDDIEFNADARVAVKILIEAVEIV